MFRLIAQSPGALQGFVANNGALGKTLDVKTRERIAIAVAQVDGCDYCLSAHTYLGLNLAKITPEEAAFNRKAQSGDAKANAAVSFAAKVVRERGHISQADVKAVREAGYSDGQIVEILQSQPRTSSRIHSTQSLRPTSTFRSFIPPRPPNGCVGPAIYRKSPIRLLYRTAERLPCPMDSWTSP
jgi:AhpD family alkylhydroperoxidase